MPPPTEPEPLPVAEARSGCADSWDQLFRRYQLPLYAYIFELVREEQPALDLVQETFISAVRHIGSLRENGKFGSWLFGIAHQKCLQQWRREHRDQMLSEQLADLPAEFSDSPDDLLIDQEQEAEFMTLLEQLPLPQRSALLLHFLEEFSLEEIAAVTETNVGTVKSRIHYGKRALKQLLAEKMS
jgi:RNA polymerase sigma-70 factor (ECF subfamily)